MDTTKKNWQQQLHTTTTNKHHINRSVTNKLNKVYSRFSIERKETKLNKRFTSISGASNFAGGAAKSKWSFTPKVLARPVRPGHQASLPLWGQVSATTKWISCDRVEVLEEKVPLWLLKRLRTDRKSTCDLLAFMFCPQNARHFRV